MMDRLFLSLSQSIGPTLSQYLTENRLSSPSPIQTGSALLDDALSGGIKANSIYEISGFLNSGKNQLALSIVTNCLSQDRKVLWIDTCSKIHLTDLIKLSCFKSSHLASGNLQYIKAGNLIHLIALLKQINEAETDYSLLVVNEFSDLIHSSFLVLEEEISRRNEKIEALKKKLESDKKSRESVGESYNPTEEIPVKGPSALVRQNKAIQQILGLLSSYNERCHSSTILLGSMNTTSQRLLLESTRRYDKEPMRALKSVYQSKLVPILGEDVPWAGLLEARIVLFKDWKDRKALNDMSCSKNAETLTCAILRFNRPLISKASDKPYSRVVKTTKKVRFRYTAEGIAEADGVFQASIIGVANTQANDSSEMEEFDVAVHLKGGASSPVVSYDAPNNRESFGSGDIAAGKRNLRPEIAANNKKTRY